MANIGYIQVVRHCNHFCAFCSNPKTEFVFSLEDIKAIVDDFVKREYFGVILTGGEPTLSPILPEIIRYIRRETRLHVRMISNGWRLGDAEYCETLIQAGLQHIHVSIYSVRGDLEQEIRGVHAPLEKSLAALENLAKYADSVAVDINCVINRRNADHLDENVRFLVERFPYVRHFVWNNLDPSMGRAETNREYIPRLADFEVSLARAMRFLHRGGRTFRVERVPLCYMLEFAECSTETRKIVKEEERIVHFLDEKGLVHQTNFEHHYAAACEVCSLKKVCGGLFDKGNGYDPAELYPVFVSPEEVAAKVHGPPRLRAAVGP